MNVEQGHEDAHPLQVSRGEVWANHGLGHVHYPTVCRGEHGVIFGYGGGPLRIAEKEGNTQCNNEEKGGQVLMT